jgi:hypothetical protein
LNIGELGMVLTRKIIFGIFLTILLIIVVYTRLDFHGGHHHLPVVPIPEKWETFLEECGTNAMVTGGGPKVHFCREKYIEKTIINWKGILSIYS